MIQNYCAGVIGQRLVLRIRNLAFAAALRQEIAYFDDTRNNTGALSSRLAVDAAQIRLLVAEGILAHVSNLSTFVAAMTIALVGGWQLALVVVGTTPLTIMSFYYSTKRLSGLQEGSRSLYEQATQLAMDAVSNIRTVASFTAEETVLRQFGERLEGPLEAARKQAVTLGVNQAITQAMNSLPQALIFYVGGVFVSHKLLTFAEMMQARVLRGRSRAQQSAVCDFTVKPCTLVALGRWSAGFCVRRLSGSLSPLCISRRCSSRSFSLPSASARPPARCRCVLLL